MSNKEDIAKALRNLVSEIYKDCLGAYGTDCYEGQYEQEIQELAEAIIRSNKPIQPEA